MESEGSKANVQTEARANQRWPSASTTRHENGEVSYGTFGSMLLRGIVQKELEDAVVIMVGMDGKLMV